MAKRKRTKGKGRSSRAGRGRDIPKSASVGLGFGVGEPRHVDGDRVDVGHEVDGTITTALGCTFDVNTTPEKQFAIAADMARRARQRAGIPSQLVDAEDAPPKKAVPLLPGPNLNERQATALLILACLPGAKGMTESAIESELDGRGIVHGLGSGSFRRHDIPALKNYGVEGRPGGLGYFLPSEDLKASACAVARHFGAVGRPTDVT